MPFENWKQAHAQGVRTEDALREYFESKGWRVSGNHNTSAYDFAVNTGKFIALVEVKDESNYQGSPNITLETKQGNPPKPSGLSVSESTIMLHYFREYAVLYRTQSMRLHLTQIWKVDSKKYKQEPFGRSDNNNWGVLFPIDSLDAPWFDVRSVESLVESPVFKP